MTEPATQYSKEPVHNLTYREAQERVLTGWKGSRQQWHDDGRNQFIFYAVSGQFLAFDKTIGMLDPFLVIRLPDGGYRPWVPTDADTNALDWAVVV